MKKREKFRYHKELGSMDCEKMSITRVMEVLKDLQAQLKLVHPVTYFNSITCMVHILGFLIEHKISIKELREILDGRK